VGAHSSGGPGARGASSRQRDCLSLLSRSLGPFRRRAAFLFACTAELSAFVRHQIWWSGGLVLPPLLVINSNFHCLLVVSFGHSIGS
jgi:hypothetical protein